MSDEKKFYFMTCKGCEKSLPYTVFRFNHEKDKDDEKKEIVSFSELCYKCNHLSILDTLDKKEYLTHEMHTRVFNSVVSTFYTDVYNLQMLLFSFRYKRDENFFKLLKVDEIKYALYVKSEDKWNIITQTEDYYKEYHDFICQLIDAFHEYGKKVEDCEKLLSECEKCEKLEENKVKICDMCRIAINAH